MKFRIKSVVSLVMAIVLCCSMMPLSASAVAYNEYPSFVIEGKERTFSEIAQKAHYDVDSLYAFYLEDPEAFIADATDLYAVDTQRITGRSSGGGSAGSDVDSLAELVMQGRKGDILISATNTTALIGIINYRHGHAAIVYDEETIVQAVAPGYNSIKTNLSGFGASTKVRLYEVAGASDTQASSAATYASNNLVNKPYSATAAAASTEYLNCATLVWQAYKSQGFTLKKYFGTVTPESLVKDTQTDAVANINWSGDQDSFAI